MRVWTLERPIGELERDDIFLGYRHEGEVAFHRIACVSPFHPSESYARWIVDALNEKERRELLLAEPGKAIPLLPEETLLHDEEGRAWLIKHDRHKRPISIRAGRVDWTRTEGAPSAKYGPQSEAGGMAKPSAPIDAGQLIFLLPHKGDDTPSPPPAGIPFKT